VLAVHFADSGIACKTAFAGTVGVNWSVDFQFNQNMAKAADQGSAEENLVVGAHLKSKSSDPIRLSVLTVQEFGILLQPGTRPACMPSNC
jgi:hypothetical protein